jgi:hypothetical protein
MLKSKTKRGAIERKTAAASIRGCFDPPLSAGAKPILMLPVPPPGIGATATQYHFLSVVNSSFDLYSTESFFQKQEESATILKHVRDLGNEKYSLSFLLACLGSNKLWFGSI